MAKIMFSVGEASGDMQGAQVAMALKALHPDIRMLGMGGQAMRAAGVEIAYDIADLGVIGLVEVIRNIPKLLKIREGLSQLMDRERPDALVIIDYYGFNIKLAAIAKAKGIPVLFYICPKVWAWGKGRAKKVAETVQRVAAIFPFEVDAYAQAGANVTFVGNPLLDIVKPALERQKTYELFGADAQKPIVLLLPGSRRQEIVKLLPVMLEAAEKISKNVKECQFFLPIASTISREMLQDIIKNYAVEVTFTEGYTYDLMSVADVAIAASGTVTLEAALLKLPTVVIYKVNALTYFLGKMLVKIPHISLPNIVAGRRIVPELLQEAASADNIASEALKVLTDEAAKQIMREDLAQVRAQLGEPGAVKRVAQEILTIARLPGGGQQ